MSEQDCAVILSNEFATVEVEADTHAGRQRLRVRSIVTEAETYFDPLELELLVSIPHRHIRRLFAGLIESPETYLEDERHDQ